MDNQNIVLTQQGLDNLKQELETLKNDKLPAAIDRLAKAREFGDLRENSEYHTAREDHAWIQGRIDELTDIVARAVVANDPGIAGAVNIGCKVTVEVNGTSHEFFIVGEWEANPAERKISHQSPLGQALVGRKIGEKVEVDAPAGKVIYTIKQVS
jgi:transcription elongation factor GreA